MYKYVASTGVFYLFICQFTVHVNCIDINELPYSVLAQLNASLPCIHFISNYIQYFCTLCVYCTYTHVLIIIIIITCTCTWSCCWHHNIEYTNYICCPDFILHVSYNIVTHIHVHLYICTYMFASTHDAPLMLYIVYVWWIILCCI